MRQILDPNMQSAGLDTSWLKINPFPRRYNVKPTQDVYVLAGGVWQLARWGLIPTWHRGEIKDWKATTINAWIEEVAAKPTFRDARRRGRALIPAGGYYEWTGAKTPKQPHLFEGAGNEDMLWFAGLAAHSNTIVDRATPFAMAGGRMGVMGEAGAEAILPLLRGPGGLGVRAIGAGGMERVLPLQRASGGALGVQVPDLGALMRRPTFFAQGGVVGRLSNPPRIGETVSGASRGRDDGTRMSVVINNNSPAAKVEAKERQGDDGMYLEVIVEQIESSMADRTRRNVGPLAGVLSNQYGLQRQGI